LKSLFTLLTKPFKDKTEVAMFFTAFFIEVAFGIYLVYRWDFTFVSGDAISHLYIPRTVIDNGPQSNLANLGTVWLPMFHLLVMPLTLIGPLYSTGLAGTIVNGLATGGICVILYRLVGDKKLGILASTLFMGNIFTLIYGATPLDGQIAIFFILLATYYFKNYWETDNVTEFMKCCLVIILGTLTRYEVWAVSFLVIFFFAFRELKNGQGYRIAYIHLPLWGIFGWLFWNLAIFRDPLMFINHPLSAPNQLKAISMFYTGSIFLTTKSVFEALFVVSGALGFVALFSIIVLFAYRKFSEFSSMSLLIAPIFVHWYLMFNGLSQGGERYFYTSLPGLILLPLFLVKFVDKPAFSMKGFKKISTILIIIIVITPILAYPIQKDILETGEGAIALSEQKLASSIHFPRVYKLKTTQGEIAKRSSIILVPAGHEGAFSVFTSTSPSDILDGYDGSLYLEAMEKPWKYSEFVVIKISSNPSSDPVLKLFNDYYKGKYFVYNYYHNEDWRSEFLEHYHPIMETENYLVFQKGD